jgi:hypothetical protein
MQVRVAVGIIILFVLSGSYSGRRNSGRRGGRGGSGGGRAGSRGGGRSGSFDSGGYQKPSWGNPSSNGITGTGCQGGVSRNTLQSKTVEAAKAELIAKLFKGNEDRYAVAVRIAFHDCVGGCDGCINRANPGNFGSLFTSLDIIDPIYDARYKAYMSRADFYVLAGVTALEESLKFNNANLTSNYIRPVKFNFKYGRCDCPTSPRTNVDVGLPHGHFDYQEVMDFFKQEFGFSVKESVAIMGAHTLGGASGARGSGFEGFWKEDATAAARLNNRYYSVLVDRSLTWENVDQSVNNGFAEQRWQWVAGTTPAGVPAPFMLNADVALYRDIQTNRNGRSLCQFNDCSLSPSAKHVKKYAKSGNRWMRDFAPVWDKLVAKGGKNLRTPVVMAYEFSPIYDWIWW